MSKDFSDKPLTVDGVTVKPTWAWSREYRAQVTQQLRALGQTHVEASEAEGRYVEWYAQENQLTLDEARAKIKGEA